MWSRGQDELEIMLFEMKADISSPDFPQDGLGPQKAQAPLVQSTVSQKYKFLWVHTRMVTSGFTGIPAWCRWMLPGQPSDVLMPSATGGCRGEWPYVRAILSVPWTKVCFVPFRPVLFPPVWKDLFLKCPVCVDWYFCKIKKKITRERNWKWHAEFFMFRFKDIKLLCHIAIKVYKCLFPISI